MKQPIIIFILGLLMICCTTTANAALVFNLGGCDISSDDGGTGSCGGSGADLPYNSLTMTFQQATDGYGGVILTMDTAEMPVDVGKIMDVWFNVGGNLTFGDLEFTFMSGIEAKGIEPGDNVSSTGIFDFDFGYQPSGTLGEFHYDMQSVYRITTDGLTEDHFNELSSEGFLAVMHVGVTGNGESGHYAASTVPIPSAAWLLGSGLIGIVGIRRQKSVK